MKSILQSIVISMMILLVCTVKLHAQVYSTPGNALNFTSSGEQVYIPDIPALDPSTVTMECWIMPLDYTNAGIVIKPNSQGLGGSYNEDYCFSQVNGKFLAVASSNGNQIIAWQNTNYNPGVWYHLAAVFSSIQISFYINGVLQQTVATGFALDHANNPIVLSPSANINYSIDELKIWNTDRTDSINADMNNIAIATAPGLVAYYNFDEGTVGADNTAITTLTDLSSNANDGSLFNFALTGTSSNWVESYAMVVPAATAATNISGTGFTANWNAPSVGVVDYYLLDVATDSNFTNFVSGYNNLIVNGTNQTITGLPYGIYSYYYRVHASKASGTMQGAYSNSINVAIPAPDYVWTGATSTDWNDSTNWTNNVLPATGVTVGIPSTSYNQPSLSSDVSIGGAVLNGSIAINGYTFTINDTVTGTGTIIGSATSSLILNSSSNNTLYFGSYNTTDSMLANLTLSGTGTVTLGSGLGITTLLTVSNGTLNTGNYLTLKSTSIDNTAVVASVGGTITGNVTVERYIPQGNRAYRDLGAEVANSGAILNNWQEGGNSPAGYGIYITGVKGAAPGGVDASTGLDMTQTGNPSLYIYGSGSWPSITNTITNSLDPFMGYRASIRGDRTYNIYAPDPSSMVNATTLRATGNLVTGDVVYNTTNVTSSVYTSTAAKLISGLDNYSFVANPYACPIDWEAVYANGGTTNLTASYWYFDPTFMSNGYATYVTYNAVSHVNSNHPTSKLDRYIQPGMAFFVQNSNSSNPTLSITESNKAPNSTKTAVYGVSAAPNYLQVSLWKNINGVNTNIDGAVAVFSNNFTKVIGDKDSKKLLNGGENLFITQANTDLSIAGLPMPVVNDEIVLNLNQVVAGTNYQLQLDASQYTNTGVEAFIKDKLLNTVVPASEGISFTPTKDASTYEGRFSIVFKATDIIAAGNIKQIAVYPNPVTGNLFNIQMGSLDKGTYKVTVVNALGKEVLNNTIQHSAGASVETIHTSTLTPGLYTVTIQGKTTVCHTEMIIGK